jgi:type II secretory pathway pseudopilin PulG
MKKTSFTLVEVLVAMGIFMVGVAPILGVVMSTTHKQQENLIKTNINSLALQKLAEFKITPPSAIGFTAVTNYPGLSYMISGNSITPGVTAYTLAIGKTTITPTSADNLSLTQFLYIYNAEQP